MNSLINNRPAAIFSVLVAAALVLAYCAPAQPAQPPPIPSEPYQIPRQGFLAEPQPPSPGIPMGTTQGQYDIYYGVV